MSRDNPHEMNLDTPRSVLWFFRRRHFFKWCALFVLSYFFLVGELPIDLTRIPWWGYVLLYLAALVFLVRFFQFVARGDEEIRSIYR